LPVGNYLESRNHGSEKQVVCATSIVEMPQATLVVNATDSRASNSIEFKIRRCADVYGGFRTKKCDFIGIYMV
jgi:hypothetical protein